MLEELNHVLMLWEILSFYLPAVAAGVIVAVTLLLVCRDRRRRSLALEAPPEQISFDNLALKMASGAFAQKIVAEKAVALQEQELKQMQEEHNRSLQK